MATELAPAREPDREKATRIVEAMRASVAERGIAGSTFDQVARSAGVSRGLLHYYFGSKERLLVEAVRLECEVRDELLEQAIADADSVEQVIDALVRSLQDFLGEGPATAVMLHEMLTLAQRNPEIAYELRGLGRRTRSDLAQALEAKAEAGVLALRDDPEAIAAFLFVLADGILVRRLSEPDFDIEPLMDKSVAAARALLS
ncbi:MAG TPA: TetR family transcriptional regulator [Solirubrobacteraceae bacterium]|jgi:AcrR family transcriptional regulator